MAHSTRARNLELNVEHTDPERVFQSAKEEPSPSVQGDMPGDYEHSPVAAHEEAGNRFENWLKKRSTARGEDGAGKFFWRRIPTRLMCQVRKSKEQTVGSEY